MSNSRETAYLNEEKHGVETEFNILGRIIRVTNYFEGKKDDIETIFKTLNPSYLHQKNNYNKGQLLETTNYDINGNLKETIKYPNTIQEQPVLVEKHEDIELEFDRIIISFLTSAYIC